MKATTVTVVTKRLVITKLLASKCHEEVDLSSSESNTDEERPTKVPRLEAATMSDSNRLCMRSDPRCVSPDFDDEDKKKKLRIPKKKSDDKSNASLLPDFYQGISRSLIPKDKIGRELYIGNIPPHTTEAVLLQFLNGAMRRVGLVGQSESASVSCRIISRSRFAFIECGTWEYAGRALNLNGISGEPSTQVRGTAHPQQDVAAAHWTAVAAGDEARSGE
jgi:hypothetical protein